MLQQRFQIIHRSNTPSLYINTETSTIVLNTSELELGKACVFLKQITHIVDDVFLIPLPSIGPSIPRL